MIVDTSVLIAILEGEAETSRLARALSASSRNKLPASCYLEASMAIVGRMQEVGFFKLDELILNAGLEIVPFTLQQARIARDAFRRYGKGRHPAGLNFGDCMSYALARDMGEELLFKGTDFALTDVAVAAY